jgi:hypothetical protein
VCDPASINESIGTANDPVTKELFASADALKR